MNKTEKPKSRSLKQLAEHVNGSVTGDPTLQIHSASTLSEARPGQISFLANIKYEKELHTTKASAVIVAPDVKADDISLIHADDPYYAFMQIVVLLHGHREHKKVGISPKACIADTAKVGVDCNIYNNVTIDDDVKIGDRCILYPGVYVGKGVTIGDDCILYANVAVYDGSKLGNRVIVNANAAIGEDGFGYATHQGAHHKIPQVGGVTLGDDVEIGSCCGIERGTLGDTVIGKGTKLGDMVAVGHGAKIGEHCLLVAQVGIAGSATIGNYCVIGGQAGIVGHIKIGNQVMIGAQAGVINNVEDGKVILGAPAIGAQKARRAYSMIQYLPDMRQSIRKVERKMAEMEKAKNRRKSKRPKKAKS